MKTLKKEIDDCINRSSDWEKAYNCGLDTIALLTKLYSGIHPDLTVELVRVLKIRLMISQDLDNDALELIGRANKNINLTHGCNHDLYKKFNDIINLEP